VRSPDQPSSVEALFRTVDGEVVLSRERSPRGRLRATVDPHSPDKNRANGVVSNMPQFQEAFHCKAGSAMVRENRCRVW